jgi:hypothetical protein
VYSNKSQIARALDVHPSQIPQALTSSKQKLAAMTNWAVASLACAAVMLAGQMGCVLAYTRPDQLAKLIKFRDENVNKGPGWQTAFSQTSVGGQYVDPGTELGGPWTCPTDPKYTSANETCDPCGNNRPNKYWGNWNHVACRGLQVTPSNTEGSSGELGDGYVSNIHITGLHLEGTLPINEFCEFHTLREFDVDHANFTGQIPDKLCSPDCFNNLQEIDFSYNQLTGTLPPCVSTMPWLSSFKVENNYRLQGTIPESYPEGPHLWWLDFGYNKFTGSVPSTFISYNELKPLVIFRMVNNSFSGDLYPLSRSHLQGLSTANNDAICGMIPNTVRYAHGFNTLNTNLGKPCPGAKYPPKLPYAPYKWPL